MKSIMNAWEIYADLLSWDGARVLYVSGPPGIGKTWLAYKHGRIDRGVWALTLTPETPATDLVGGFRPNANGIEFADGPALAAMRAGGRLVVNEVTHGSEDVYSILHPILESHETAMLTLPDCSTVKAAPGFHVVLTDNMAPDSLPFALRDRQFAKVALREPHPDSLALLPEDLRQPAMACVTADDERQTGMREWHAFAALRDRYGAADAAVLAFGQTRGRAIYTAHKIAGIKSKA